MPKHGITSILASHYVTCPTRDNLSGAPASKFGSQDTSFFGKCEINNLCRVLGFSFLDQSLQCKWESLQILYH